MTISKKLTTVIIFCGINMPVWCQANQDANSILALAKSSALSNYEINIKASSLIFNGREYLDPYVNKNLEGHLYFLSEDWLAGSIFYDGEVYSSVPLKFNLLNGKVIVENPQAIGDIELVSEKIKYFSIGSHLFIDPKTIQLKRKIAPQAKFLDLLYEGKTSVVADRQKSFKKKEVDAQLVYEVWEQAHYFIIKDGDYIPVKSKSQVLKVLTDRKSDLKKFIIENKIRFQADKEVALKRLIEKYNQIKDADGQD